MTNTMYSLRMRWIIGLALLSLWLPAAVYGAPTDGDTDAAEGDGAESESPGDLSCLRDSDCPETEICRDEGFCLPYQCAADADCRHSDFYCRRDKVCAPKTCSFDSDCVAFELCMRGACISDPTGYVDGGAGSCQTTTFASSWEQLGAVLIGVLLLLWFRLRRNRI